MRKTRNHFYTTVPFTLTKWDGTGLAWQLLKNEEYWDKETVKLNEINYDVVKEQQLQLNFTTTVKKDRAGLSGEFAMQYAADPEASS